MQEPAIIEQVAKGVGLALAITSLGAVFIKIGCWFRKKRQARKQREQEQLDLLKQLCAGQADLDERLDNMEGTLAAMDGARQEARVEDARIRTRMYLGTVAVVDAVMKLAEHQGLTINGEVAAYRRDNIDNLKNGVGIAPLHAQPKPKEG